ncbi:Signal transduction histidine-protein kinase BarA [Thalassocella blandensis]|nr:Signal transduction histidine-protein kinase BarA [Thalassocella blandensis]
MINHKILDRRLFLLEYAPSLITCLLISLLFIILNFQYQRNNEELQLNYIRSLFSDQQNIDTDLFEKHSKSLLLTGSYQSISLLNQERKIVAQFGLPLSDTDLTMLREGKQHWTKNSIKHTLLQAKTNTGEQYSIHVASSTKNIELWAYRSLLIVLATTLVALGLIYAINRKFRENLKSEGTLIETALTRLEKGEYGEIVESQQHSLFQPLQNKVNSLSISLQTSTQKLQHTIDQSVKDLEETLETVEIQNIEIDLARKNAIKANQAKSEFLASTSHEIRTPLNGILGFTNLMRKTNLTPQQEEYLETIEDSAQVLLLNINDIIDFSRLEIGKLNLEYKPIYLRDLIKESQKYILTHSNLSDVILNTDEKSSIPAKLLGDPLRVKQVYTNLLSNALTLCQSHKITTALEIHNREDNQSLLKVELICHGEGLDIRELQTAQTLLRSPDPAHEKLTNKNHMGLVIAKGLVERMNGEIGLSTREQATVFWFTVLLGKPNVEVSSDESASVTSILVVDDNPSNRRLICELLNDLHVLVTSAGSGQEAIELCKKQNFSLVLMDIQMPGLNGFETTQIIRENEEKNCRTPIVALTAHAVEDAKSQLLLSGLDDFVSKPIGETELKELLNRWVSYSSLNAPAKKLEQPEESSRPSTLPEHSVSQPPLSHSSSPQSSSPQSSSPNIEGVKKPVDITESLNLAKGKADLARDMLVMLIDSLRQEFPTIKQLWENKQYDAMQDIIHQIHGGACYCGVPKLLASSKTLDKALKDQQYDRCKPLVDAFFYSSQELLDWADSHDVASLFDIDIAQ